jgi:hypothetical protein
MPARAVASLKVTPPGGAARIPHNTKAATATRTPLPSMEIIALSID